MISSILVLLIYFLCVDLLLFAGRLCGWSYIDTTTYVCEYIAPFIIVFLCLLTIIKGIKFFKKSKFSWKWIATAIIGVFNLSMFISKFHLLISNIVKHPEQTDREIFNTSIDHIDYLEIQAAMGGLAYFTENIKVYVLPYLLACTYLFLQILINNSIKNDYKKIPAPHAYKTK